MVRMHNDPKGGRSTRKAAGTCAMAYRRTNTRVLPARLAAVLPGSWERLPIAGHAIKHRRIPPDVNHRRS